jgi:hypothetical protein
LLCKAKQDFLYISGFGKAFMVYLPVFSTAAAVALSVFRGSFVFLRGSRAAPFVLIQSNQKSSQSGGFAAHGLRCKPGKTMPFLKANFRSFKNFGS